MRLFEIRGKTWLDWQLPCPSLSLSLMSSLSTLSFYLSTLYLSLYLLSSPPPISAASIYSRLLFRSTFSLHLLCRYLVFATVVAGGDCEEELSKQWWGRAVELILPIFNHRGTYLFHPTKQKVNLVMALLFLLPPSSTFFVFSISLKSVWSRRCMVRLSLALSGGVQFFEAWWDNDALPTSGNKVVKLCGQGGERGLCTVLCVGDGEGAPKETRHLQSCSLAASGCCLRQWCPSFFCILLPSFSSSSLLWKGKLGFFCTWVVLNLLILVGWRTWLPQEEGKLSSRKLEVQIFNVLFVDCGHLDQDCCGFG